jgi:DNA-binding NtrC family response regulator
VRNAALSNPADPNDDDQRALDFEADGLRARDEKALLTALTTALSVLVRAGDTGAALRESFSHAIGGLDAEKGVVVQLVETDPPQLEILCGRGLSSENEAACRELLSSPGISPSVIRQALETGQSCLVENSQIGGMDQTASLQGRPYSVICAPVVDTLTRAPIAVLYFQNDVRHAFDSEDLEWLTAYAAVLGQALTLHVSTQRQLQEIKTELKRPEDVIIVGDSAATRRLRERLDTYLPSTATADPPPILVVGDSGTGKELVARYLHHYSPKRSRGPFQTCNCATLRGELAESKLFGHTKGAFTGAVAETLGLFRAADKGVLFLDEIGDMPLEAQALLLRVLETRHVMPVGAHKEVPVDVQVVAATHRQLDVEVREGHFREDLWYRLNGLRVELLPLRDPARIADIKALLKHFLERQQLRLNKRIGALTPQAYRALLQHGWPGNVRDLSNVCTSLVTHAAPGAFIGIDEIERHRPEVLRGPRNPNPEALLEDDNITWDEALRALRKRLLEDRIRRHGSPGAVARSLGISEATFYRYAAEMKRSR